MGRSLAAEEWILSRMAYETNFRVIRRSRKRPQAGDVFAMQILDRRYLFGRVVCADLPSGQAPAPEACLLYIYRILRDTKHIDPEELKRSDLLIHPVFSNRLGWTRGYFETIAHHPLQSRDVLERHCFWHFIREKYVDEHDQVLPEPIPPCGQWTLMSYRRIDDLVSEALGIPRAPADPDDL
jgi:Immunity protein 26